MAISARQAELFAGESWTSIYTAFKQINFNATDPVSINTALQDYIRVNYPENFNDWIVSSEFVAIVDLLSWLAGTLAFKTDLAARENFIDTAESRDSILRLARFLSYNPSRCQAATGIVKLVNIVSDDDIFDSFGTNLANTSITWSDPSNVNWMEQFTAVLNGAFVSTNPFGIPLKAGNVANTITQLYRLNGFAASSALSFSAAVNGTGMDFEVCNGDFIDGGTLFERPPDPSNAFDFYYLNDGNGNDSRRTGFFLLFKQGSTRQQIFNIAVPIENQMLDLGSSNINQNDVWVQSIDEAGRVLLNGNWTKVPSVSNTNITFNDIPPTYRNIFSVITRDNDQVTIRFSDGFFGNAPAGLLQVTYRVSNGLSYQIRPLEINNITLPMTYLNAQGVTRTLVLTFSLYETITNAAAAETVEQIRQRAPQVYAAQNRMVSGEDYNAFPLSSNLAAKIKAVNRVYSGQSRYIDLGDPTGTYQDLSLIGEDGIIFADPRDTYIEIPTSLNKTTNEIIANYLMPALDQYTTMTLISDVLLQNIAPALNPRNFTATNTWIKSSASLFQTTGWFVNPDNLLQPGAIILFVLAGEPRWVAVLTVDGAPTQAPLPNTAGPVTLAQDVPSGAAVVAILPSASVLPAADVISVISNNITLKLSFSLWYDYNPAAPGGPVWRVNAALNDFGAQPPSLVAPTTGLPPNQLLIAIVNYSSGMWQINSRGLDFVFESINDVEWFDNGKRALARSTGEAKQDLIRVLRINPDLNDPAGRMLGVDYNLAIDRLWLYPDGTPEPRRTIAVLHDSNQDGYPDRPDTFYKLLTDDPISTYLFWSNAAQPPYDQPIYSVTIYDTASRQSATPAIGSVGFQLDDATFWVYTNVGWQQDSNGTYRVERGRGPNVAAQWMVAGVTTTTGETPPLIFHWKHYAPSDHRIDPATTNIHDIFVLTYAYDTLVRQWIAAGGVVADQPASPTELDLRLAFASLEQLKMFSDQIVWRPVRYKFLFGRSADAELQGQFKVIRLPNAAVSDGEIKRQIIAAINSYFAVSNWDFGETFFYTELAAYIHQQLVGLIGSVVLVPLAAESAFGEGFEVASRSDEIFISTAQVSDIILISSNTAVNLRIRN